MTKNDIQLLYAYNDWANDRAMRASAALNPEQFTRGLGGSFPSIRDTLLHIVGGHWIWLAYWKDPPQTAASLSTLLAQRNAQFHPDAFPNVPEVQLKWAQVQQEQSEFLNGVTEESLGQLLPFRNSQVRLAHLMQHLVNHSTYHRGQVALMMRQLGAEPLATDFHSFLVEGSSTASTPK
jgi:uncharacterized damage-inducible protein DinB